MLNKKNNIANKLCKIRCISKEKAVSKRSRTEDILHLSMEKRKYEVEAFTIINIGCIGLFQYEEIAGSSPIAPMYINGAISAIIITHNFI
jgi:hypothetical protein